MKTVEVLLDNIEFDELNISDFPITLKELEVRLSRIRALKALAKCNEIAKIEGLDKMTNEEINGLIFKARNEK
jgi:hypothetical protein